MTKDHIALEFQDIGERLRAFRMGRGMTPDQLAAQIGVSRAALYRAEKGHIPKIETLTRISVVLGASLPTLLGVGVEYIDSAVAYFERMRQFEEHSRQIVMLFGPVSYLLTSDHYDDMLREGLLESVLEGDPEAAAPIDALMEILRERKAQYIRKRPSIVSLIASADLERFLLHGLIGRHDLSGSVLALRRFQARREVQHIQRLLRDQPIGVQIGIVRETVPATTFQIFRQQDRSVLAISPFRLGERPNVGVGVALVTSAPEAMALHESMAERLWERALKGPEGADHVEALIERYGQSVPVESGGLAAPRRSSQI